MWAGPITCRKREVLRLSRHAARQCLADTSDISVFVPAHGILRYHLCLLDIVRPRVDSTSTPLVFYTYMGRHDKSARPRPPTIAFPSTWIYYCAGFNTGHIDPAERLEAQRLQRLPIDRYYSGLWTFPASV